MNTRLIKETRDLLPIFAGALLLIIVPYLILGHGNAAEFGCLTFGLSCAVLGGCSFGNEFQHRTISLLLSQPVARSVLWREKMLVLGASMLTSLLVLVVCLQVYSPMPDRWDQIVLALIALCAFCGVPYWTLRLRHSIAGMVFAVATPASIPCLLLLVNMLLPQPFDDKTVAQVSAIPVVICCALFYRLGYAEFKGLQVLDGPASPEVGLPAGLEALFVGPLTRVAARFHSPFATLLKKELRLQQISFILAGLFIVLAGVGFCLYKHHPDLAGGIMGCGFAIDVVLLPLIAGATSLAEEKGWGIAEWHLTLPSSALKQWSAKMLATLSTSLALGLLLPAALFLAGQALFGQPGAGDSLPPAGEMLCWMLGQLLLTSVAVYAASFSNSTLRAILAALAIIAVGCEVCYLVGTEAFKIIGHIRFGIRMPGPSEVENGLIPSLLAAGLFLMLCVVQWFAWSNFRRCALSARRMIVQLLVIYFALGLIALAIALVICDTLFRH